MAGHHAARPQRMDLLDRIRQESGDQKQADQLGLREPLGGEAAPLLLARLSASGTKWRRRARLALTLV